jgi:hypothetical protein
MDIGSGTHRVLHARGITCFDSYSQSQLQRI